ncbi:SusC/RagA family TonB-linked outer membrane protein [Parapedobacter sp. 10938]|uniref:SusC/RagA family TonB-linked outer membrane protein n=1 Tax=Parapedobacter flavus TaxID=3110225 RepID=UPI002DBE4E95|nr:TonB-dependent receptor [Parapedobacter sp. 10938]MEC3878494.1 TonB-dependent receptor [Parapedobacter sp. 10938]
MNSYVDLKGRARLALENRVLRNLVLTTAVVLAAMSYVSAGMLRAADGTVYRMETSVWAPNSMLQDIEVRGTIRDSTGSLLTGVSIHVKNRTSIGTTTDLNGRYVLSVPAGSTLTFSMVGFETREIVVGEREVIDVVLLESSSMLDDVVVTAFGGAVKRTDMIGAVTSVNPSDLKVPSSNLTTALAGRVAGMIAYQRSGEPGMDNADFFIRGVTTFGYKKDPLILIDNLEVSTTELARLQTDDIASFSIMKDATATALYGARGANGVILITTKEGTEGKMKINLRVENSLSAPTRNVELADPITYMELHNEAVKTRDPLGEQPYSQAKIDNTKAGTNPIAYPATDWRKELFKDYTMNQRFNLNLSGGGSIARYYVAGALTKDHGVLKVDPRNNFNSNINLTSYNLRSNVNVNLTKSTELIIRMNGNFDDYTGPIAGGKAMYNMVMRTNPVLFPAYYPVDDEHRHVSHIMFGNYEEGGYLNPYAEMVKGYRDYSRSYVLAQLELKQDLSFLTEGLQFRALMNTNRTSFFDVNRAYTPFWYTLSNYNRREDTYGLSLINENSGQEYLGYSEGPKQVSSIFYLESALNYSRTVGEKHGLSGMLVYIMQQRLSANAGSLQLSLPYRNMGLSGRATYAYDSRYFLEFNFGYNGSERFYTNHRFGFFPSAGLAWTISNEKFFEPLTSTVNNLRLRATYGLVGNDEIGSPSDRFFYLSNVDMEAGGAVFGRDNNYSRTGVTVTRYANSAITWEQAKKFNVALEVGLFDKLDITADFFKEHRTNILMTRADIPTTMGLSADVRANVGEATGQGVDVSANYSHSFMNGLWLQALGNFTFAQSAFKVYEEPEYDEWWKSRVGYSVNQEWGYIAERLFVDEYEVANSPRQNFGEYMAGDIKYRDVNRDGRITELDMVPIGYPTTPEIVYGFGFSAGYKNFDISVFFQGLARESFRIGIAETAPFINERQLLKAYADDHWSEDNRNLYALWPRLTATTNTNNTQRSTWFQRDGTFLRLKQAEMGYSLPHGLTNRMGLKSLRFYVSGTNLLAWSKFKLWDVEMAANGLGYPVQRVVNLGLHVSL